MIWNCPVIADTFALWDEAGNYERTNDTAGTGEYMGEEERQIIETILDGFVEAYFHGDADAAEKKIENGKCNVSMEFRDSDYEDMFLYVTVILAKEEERKEVVSSDLFGIRP